MTIQFFILKQKIEILGSWTNHNWSMGFNEKIMEKSNFKNLIPPTKQRTELKDSQIEFPNFTMNIILFGDAACGKTSLILKYVNNNFPTDLVTGWGIEFKTKYITIEHKICKLQIYDLDYQSELSVWPKMNITDTVFLLYDITDQDSFNNLPYWIEIIKSNCENATPKILIGNKRDLETRRIISTDQGRKFANDNGYIFIEISAKTGFGIETLFNRAAKEQICLSEKNIFQIKLMEKMNRMKEVKANIASLKKELKELKTELKKIKKKKKLNG